MKHWLILLSALMVAGCASQPMELPDWTSVERKTEIEATDPIQLPVLCEIPLSGTWPVECWKRLDVYDIAAQANYEAAVSNANALRASDASYDQLVEAGKLQSQLATIREEMLARERQAHTMDSWFYRIVIALGLLGAAL